MAYYLYFKRALIKDSYRRFTPQELIKLLEVTYLINICFFKIWFSIKNLFLWKNESEQNMDTNESMIDQYW